jgi:hypothetical protein
LKDGIIAECVKPTLTKKLFFQTFADVDLLKPPKQNGGMLSSWKFTSLDVDTTQSHGGPYEE